MGLQRASAHSTRALTAPPSRQVSAGAAFHVRQCWDPQPRSTSSDCSCRSREKPAKAI
jgi:hypothetical protein